MAQSGQAGGLSHVVGLAAAAIIIGALYLAQDVLVPIALAILFSFLLSPLVQRVQRVGLGRVLSVILVVLLASGLVVGIGYVVTSQLVGLTLKLPEYRNNIRNKVRAFRGHSEGGLTKVTETLQEIRQELTTQPATGTAPADAQQATTSAPALADPARETGLTPPRRPERPVPVEVVQPTSMWQTARDALGYLAGPLGTAAIVFVLVIFMLLQREDLRDRFIALMGRGRINVTTIAIDDAGARISRYLLMQLVVNATYGIPVGVLLYLIGVPNALLWGLLATLLRYLPYVGPWIAASMPILLSLAVFDDWYHVGIVVAMFIVLELISNNVVEPLLYGSSTGMSAVAVLISAVFWTWLWGPVGLFLATPITACIVVMGKYIPQLEFLSVLLGDEQVLAPETRFYQRLLAMDQEEAEDLMEEFLEKGSLLQAYDQFLIPALHLAEQDRHRGRIEPERHAFMFSTIRSMVSELGESKITQERQAAVEGMRRLVEHAPAGDAAKAPPDGDPDGREPRPAALVSDSFRVLCVPARDEADEIAATMLTQVLDAKGLPAESITTHHLKSEMVDEIRETAARVVCISAMPPGALPHARYACKRLAPLRDVHVIVGLWDLKAPSNKAENRLSCAGATHVVRTFKEAVELIQQIAFREMTHAPGSNVPNPAIAS
jgi:predicted PurR-regulated permease PerM